MQFDCIEKPGKLKCDHQSHSSNGDHRMNGISLRAQLSCSGQCSRRPRLSHCCGRNTASLKFSHTKVQSEACLGWPVHWERTFLRSPYHGLILDNSREITVLVT